MPRVSGSELLELLAADPTVQSPPVILVTGIPPDERDALDTSRVHAVLPKPFDVQDVIEAIERAFPARASA